MARRREIISDKNDERKKYYRIKWVDDSKPTWELSSDVSDALKIQFHTFRTLQGRRRKRKRVCYIREIMNLMRKEIKN